MSGAAVLGAGATALLRAGRARPDLRRRGHRYVRGPDARRGDAGLGRAAGRVRYGPRDWADAAEALHAPLVIATTPAGAADALAAAVPDRPGTLFDVLYEPWPTPLAAAWAERGGAVVGGLDLLVHQAVLQVELMTGRAPGAAGRDARGRRGRARRPRPTVTQAPATAASVPWTSGDRHAARGRIGRSGADRPADRLRARARLAGRRGQARTAIRASRTPRREIEEHR